MPTQQATFGAGCFWGVEETFRKIPGVIETAVGYAGGHVKAPTYQHVCQNDTGHAEVVQMLFDPDQITYEQLLDIFWECHDPTQLNRQGFDVGSQYRSVIFYHTPEQKNIAELSKARAEKATTPHRDFVTEILPAGEFYKAEAYHQQYICKKNLGSH